jgi:FtsH-binding integral membrane protein
VISKAPATTARPLVALAADLACVLVFAVAGRASHEASSSAWVVLAIAWPYALAAVLAHVVLLARRRQPRRIWPEGVVVVAVTYVLGMGLRVLSGRGIAPAFLVVAVTFLVLTMLGWRLVARVGRGRRFV